MKWVVLAIVVFIAAYTFVNLRYRKAGPGRRPYEETSRHVTTVRLQDAGWEHLPVEVRRPIEKPPAGLPTAVQRGALGLGLDLDACFADRPTLMSSIDAVAAPAAVARGEECIAWITATLPDQQLQLGDLQLLHHGTDLVLVPTLEVLPGRALLSRWKDNTYVASFSTAGLAPGTYRVRVVAHGPAAAWNLVVK